MGYGMDEAWEHEEPRQLSKDEKVAIRFFEYDEGEWLALSTREQAVKVRIAKKCCA